MSLLRGAGKKKPVKAGVSRLAKFKRLQEISGLIKLNALRVRRLQILRHRQSQTRWGERASAMQFLEPRNKEAKERIARLWAEQGRLAKEFVTIMAEEGVREGYVRWKKRQMSKTNGTSRSRTTKKVLKIEWNGTLEQLADQLVDEYKDGKHRSKRAAQKHGCKTYTYKFRPINANSLYQYMKGK